MPPLPSSRCSPGRELRVEKHKRGLSLDGGLLFREKDEDLALFNEMQTKDSDNFLLQSTDDFEDTFSTKLRHFSDYKLGISIPARGEASDLLNVDGEKNDYDWLLTPPDTPLFPSLDDEPPPVNTVRRGRPRSQPISISRSSTMDKNPRSNRGSASPNRSSPNRTSPNRTSPSPRSGTSMLQSRGRPSSAPNSSPTPIQRQATPPRRPSTPPSKPSTPVRRSLTPTPPRISTKSGSGVRGVSPVKTSRGNSSSPKTRAWQTDIPGFSSDAPPNLRTSLADRPASYVRGSSPASRNGRDSTLKVGRQSMSPTPSRSSSHSHDRDRFSSHSKGSAASSGDDDVDSLQSFAMGSSDYSASKKVGSYPNNRALTFSKKSAKALSPSSAPKRSFDSALRQMDQRKTPPNMFRPLLSSVPSSTFYVGKTSSAHRSLISRTSVTTGSNASPDQVAGLALDTAGSEHNQEDMASDDDKSPYPDAPEEMFALDNVDAMIDDVVHVIHDESRIQLVDFDRGPTTDLDLCNPDELAHRNIDMEISARPASLHMKEDVSVVDLEDIDICSNCGCKYHDDAESGEIEIKLCPDCGRRDKLLTVAMPENIDLVAENSQMDEFELLIPVLESLQVAETDGCVKEGHDSSIEQIIDHSQNESLARSLAEDADQQETAQPTVSHSLNISERSNGCSRAHVDVSEGTDISVLLKRSTSVKEPVLQGRTFTAATRSYDDQSYVRDSMRSSFGHGSRSTSSSVDFSSSRRAESRLHRQSSSKKSDMESYKTGQHKRSQSTGTSVSGLSNGTHTALSLATSNHEDGESSNGVLEEEPGDSKELMETVETRIEVLVEDPFECNGSASIRLVDAYTTELSSDVDDIWSGDKEVAACLKDEEPALHENGDNLQENSGGVADTIVYSSEKGCTVLDTTVDGGDSSEVPHGSLEIESEHCDHSTAGLLVEDDFQKPSDPLSFDKESTSSVREAKASDHAHDILEGSTVRLEGKHGRSLTLEEATDTILLCSSIVHDLAYQAAAIAMEKENSSPPEDPRPTVTILGKSNPFRNSPQRTIVKRASKSNKARQRRLETDPEATKLPSSETENDENVDESFTRNVRVPNKVDSMKPPPLKLESKCNCTIM